MGESRKRRQAYQWQHGGALPPPNLTQRAADLHIMVATGLRDAIDAEFEAMPKRGQTRQDFLEKLLLGGFQGYMKWKAEQAASGTIVKLASSADLSRLTPEGGTYGQS